MSGWTNHGVDLERLSRSVRLFLWRRPAWSAAPWVCVDECLGLPIELMALLDARRDRDGDAYLYEWRRFAK
jgi:hypothetical protein